MDEIVPEQFSEPRQKFLQWYLKRVFDILLSSIVIVFIFPILVISAIAIVADSRGPVFFVQRRIGFLGKEFPIVKLRTMYLNAGQSQFRTGILVKPQDDPRVTRVGRFLRRTSLDEIPQFFNVLIGQMSIIGPRPLIPRMLSPFPDLAAVRNRMRPGITGLWQIRDRANGTHVSFMVKHDIEYVEHFSLLLDFKILLKTPWVVLSGIGAR